MHIGGNLWPSTIPHVQRKGGVCHYMTMLGIMRSVFSPRHLWLGFFFHSFSIWFLPKCVDSFYFFLMLHVLVFPFLHGQMLVESKCKI